MGFRCRFLSSHCKIFGQGHGFQALGLQLSYNLKKLQSVSPAALQTDRDRLQWAYDTRGELNIVGPDSIRAVRSSKSSNLPITKAYLNSLGEPLDARKSRNDRAPKIRRSIAICGGGEDGDVQSALQGELQ